MLKDSFLLFMYLGVALFSATESFLSISVQLHDGARLKGDPGQLETDPGLLLEVVQHGAPSLNVKNIVKRQWAPGPPGPAPTPSTQKGQKGQIGQKGEKGHTGQKGQKGHTGHTGQKGIPGPVGDTGIPGKDGIPGLNGEKGDRGPQGMIGPQGMPGLPGPMASPLVMRMSPQPDQGTLSQHVTPVVIYVTLAMSAFVFVAMMIFFIVKIARKCCHQPNRNDLTNNGENKVTLKVNAMTELNGNRSDATTQTISGVEPTSNNRSNEQVHYTRREQGMTPGNREVDEYYDYVDDVSIITRPNYSYRAHQYRNVNLSSNAPSHYYNI